ncbi:LysM peptidoglycan-binding domain-containing protein, partial [Vibrio mimicus]
MTPYSFRLVLLLLSSLLFGCAAQSPAPVSGLGKDYNTIERGSYRGSYYEVKKGDTLYFIAYLTDKDVNDLISYNDLAPPYTIHPGQKLKLW